MSEFDPGHERHVQPLRDKCNHCETNYGITDKNAYLFTYEKQPDLNHLVCKCLNCEGRTIMFTNDEITAQARGLGIGESVGDYAPEERYQQWLRVKGIELVQPVEITDRHEKLVSQFGKNLMLVTAHQPDLFWDEMNSPADYRPYPQRWT